MARKRQYFRFRYIYEEFQFAVMCCESVEYLIELRKADTLPHSIQWKKFNGEYLYAVSFSTYTLILGLKSIGIRRLFDLFRDAEKNKFLAHLQQNYRTLDLSSYL